MAYLNNVILAGNLVADPEGRSTKTGKSVANFRIAINSRFNKEVTTYVDCEAWEQSANFLTTYLKKGDGVMVEGELKTDSWETPDGQRRSKLVVRCNSVQGMSSGGGTGNKTNGSAKKTKAQVAVGAGSNISDEEHIPF